MQKEPSSFLPTHGGSFYDLAQHSRPQPTPPSQAAQTRRIEPAPASPLLVISTAAERFVCTLSKELMARVPHLKAGGRVLLVPPLERGGQWFLNTLPPPGMGSRIPERGVSRFRIHPITRTHFLRPTPQLAPGSSGGKNRLAAVANQNVLLTTLTFTLGPEMTGDAHRGQYLLLPERGR